jgi:hypothetical protein
MDDLLSQMKKHEVEQKAIAEKKAIEQGQVRRASACNDGLWVDKRWSSYVCPAFGAAGSACALPWGLTHDM